MTHYYDVPILKPVGFVSTPLIMGIFVKYRPEIDGLRTIAVVPVVLFHAKVPGFGGGFVGVDIFFVISGYLITTILLREVDEGQFSILRFYERRARRILPALTFVVGCCLPFAYALLLPDDMVDFMQSIVATFLFSSNVLFWQEVNYFASDAGLKPLLHTWSLAVEEQFYIFFPLLLMLIASLKARNKAAVFLVLGCLSFGICLYLAANSPSANYYLLPSRVWELLAGSLCALYLSQALKVPAHEGVGLIGLVGLLISISMIDAALVWPSPITVLPVLSTCMIIVCVDGTTRTGRILSFKPMVGVGLISYSAYLWHQPLFAFVKARTVSEPGHGLLLIVAAASFLLAYLTWKFVETPFRTKRFSQKSIFALSGTAMVILVAIGLAGHFSDGWPSRVPAGAVATAAFKDDKNPYNASCMFIRYDRQATELLEGCTDFVTGEKIDVMFIGDSHMHAFSHQAQKMLQAQGVSSYALSFAGCIGLPGFFRADLHPNLHCDQYNRDMLSLAKAQGIETLVVASRFPLYIDGSRFSNTLGRTESGKPAFVDTLDHFNSPGSATSTQRATRVAKRIAKELEALSQGFRVILVYPIPEAAWEVPSYLAKCDWFNLSCFTGTPADAYNDRAAPFVDAISDVVTDNGVIVVEPYEVFCRQLDLEACRIVDKGQPLYADNNHLAESTGAKLLAEAVTTKVLSAIEKE